MNKSIFDNDVKFEILISTMNKISLSFLDSMFPYQEFEKLNILIINQTIKGKELNSHKDNIRVINDYNKGLSISRNLAIKNAIGEICLIADDDVEYLPNFNKIILKTFSRQKLSSVIRFKIDTFSGKVYKIYPKVSKRVLNKKDIENASSIEIAFKRKDIILNRITFNNHFGLGSYFESGEEYLFLKEVLNQELIINFENETIVKHKLERSTSNMGSNSFIKAKAAIYYHDYKELSYLLLLKFIIFLLRKKLIPFNSVIKKYRVGLSSIKLYKKLERDDK
jgi:glycosyltransferase involved in cell wall biosynthesis